MTLEVLRRLMAEQFAVEPEEITAETNFTTTFPQIPLIWWSWRSPAKRNSALRSRTATKAGPFPQ